MDGTIHQDRHRGDVRTDMHCHNCHAGFLALLDHDIDGQHVIECPHCGHEHYRVITAGKVTESRHGSDPRSGVHRCRRVWKHSVLKMQTTTASEFIRNRWLNFNA